MLDGGNLAKAVTGLMRDLYFDGPTARALLLEIGCRPAQIPEFRSAETFWPEMVLRLNLGIIADGVPLLLEAAVRDHPGSKAARDLLARTPGGSGRPTVLCLLADPLRLSKIRIDREARLLREIEELGGFELRIRHAVRTVDITRSILKEKPDILHFAGHGGSDGELLFEDELGGAAAVGPSALAQAVTASTTDLLRCVVLNSCFTGANAEAFRGAAQVVVGSTNSLRDDCALAFARGFYTGIGTGRSVVEAYEIGRAQMSIEDCDTSGLRIIPFLPADH